MIVEKRQMEKVRESNE